MAGLGAVFAQDPNAKTRLSKSLTGYQMLGDKTDYGAVKQGIETGQQMIAEPIKAAYNNAKAGLSDPKVLAQYIRKGINVDALTKASDWRMAGIDAMTGSSDMPKDVQRAGVEAGMNIAMNAPAMTVWHGSPHKFSKFDMSKIGTGEGAQAYGHGLYFAENAKIAGGYRDKLAKNEVLLDGNKVKHDFNATDPQSLGLNALTSEPSAEGAAKALRDAVADPNLWGKGTAYESELASQYAAAADWLDKNASRLKIDSGALYKSDIPDEAVARFLDWDKPLSQQAPEVQAVLNPVIDKHFKMDGEWWGDPIETGRDLYNRLGFRQDIAGAGTQGAADWLKGKGVPGIRYLDGGSRGTGAGTSNFVLFDDQLPRILEVNGQATGLQPWAKGEWGNAAVNSQKGSIIDDLVMRRDMTQADYDALSFDQKQLLAQRRAALPTEQGGLGLPVDNTYQQRANQPSMFPDDAYHGTGADIREFATGNNSTHTAGSAPSTMHWVGGGPSIANGYALSAYYSGNPNVMPLKINKGKEFSRDMKGKGPMSLPGYSTDAYAGKKLKTNDSVTLQNFKDAAVPGYGGGFGDHIAIKDASNIRSRFAAFDPFRRNDADLLGNINPTLLSAMGVGATGAAVGATQLPDEYKSAIANAFSGR
jgi:hypothetical protein